MAGEQKYKIENEVQARSIGARIAMLSPKNGPLEIIIRKFVKKRTLPQNSLYWAWLTIIGNELGYDRDDMHDVMRERFLPWTEVEVCGVLRKRLTSTSDNAFTTAMMSEYMGHIDRFAASELGILLPHPEDDHYQTIAR